MEIRLSGQDIQPTTQISHCVDTEISLSRPESGRNSVFGKTFSENDGTVTWLRDSKIQHPNRSCTHCDDNAAEKFSQYGNR
jgi:hypothetical protein